MKVPFCGFIQNVSQVPSILHVHTVFPHIRPAGIIILHSLQMRVLLENTTFLLHKVIRIAGIIRDAGNIRGRSYMRRYGMYIEAMPIL